MESNDGHRAADVAASLDAAPAASHLPATDADRAASQAAGQKRFFALVGLLERLMPRAQRIGGDGPAAQERIRFRHSPELIFNAADVQEVRLKDRPLSGNEACVEVTTTFLGLTGTVSPMPSYIAEEVAREDPDFPTRRDFLDVLHHRAISLLYRSVSRYDCAREATTDPDDLWNRRFAALGGNDAYTSAAGKKLPSHMLLRLLPLLSGRARSAEGLQVALREVLSPILGAHAQVNMRWFTGGWVQLDPAQRMELGWRNHVLGRTTTLGQRVCAKASRFAVTVGPVRRVNLARFRDDGDQLRRIQQIVDLFTRAPVSWDLRLELAEDARLEFRLSAGQAAAGLGRATWLRARQGRQTLTVKDAGRPEDEGTRGVREKPPPHAGALPHRQQRPEQL